MLTIYSMLVLAAETGAQYEAGGLADQPADWVDLLAWFVPMYRDRQFNMRVKMVLGDGKPQAAGHPSKKGPLAAKGSQPPPRRQR